MRISVTVHVSDRTTALMRDRPVMDLNDAQIKLAASAMITGGWLYGGLTVRSPRPALVRRMVAMLMDEGLPVDEPQTWPAGTDRLAERLRSGRIMGGDDAS